MYLFPSFLPFMSELHHPVSHMVTVFHNFSGLNYYDSPCEYYSEELKVSGTS